MSSVETPCTAPKPSGTLTILVRTLFSRSAMPYWIIFGAALLVRAIHQYFVSAQDPMYGFILFGGDNYNYDRWAQEISQTFWLGWDRIPFSYGPLYPYFLGFLYLRFGHEHDAVAWAQHLLGAGTVTLLFHAARRLFGPRPGWFAGLGAAACPLYLFYEGELLVETIVLFCFALFLCVLLAAVRRDTLRAWLLLGGSVGLCCLGRPNTLLLIPALALWILLTAQGRITRRALAIGLFVGAAIAMMAPAALANYLVGHQFHWVSATGDYNLYVGNAPDATGVFCTTPSMRTIREQEQKHDLWIDWRAYLWKEIKADPALLPRKLWLKTRLFWQSGELPCDVNFYLRQPFSPLYRLPLRWAVIAPLGLLGMALALLRNRPWNWKDERLLLLLVFIVYMTSVILIFVPGRLRMPALAMLFLFAGYATAVVLEKMGEGMRTRNLKAMGTALMILGLAAALGLGLRTRNDAMLIRWNDHLNLGSAYEMKGQYPEALTQYEKALQREPGAKALITIRDNLQQRMQPHP